jgi:hypothetical protein
METALRNALRLTITACRRLLEEDFRLQLEGHYDIRSMKTLNAILDPGHLSFSGHVGRQVIAAAIQHEIAQGTGFDSALERFIRESAFTTLNRLAALKLLEDPSRKLIPESIGQKDNSKGYRQFAMVSPELIRSETRRRPDGGYCLYLEMLFDDLAHAVGVLFDRDLPQSILFPSTTCLDAVLNELNKSELAAVWPEDETIGWIYQYFTPPELRDKVRKESAAPRNSYELAFRNQFYTPRYVVEFLTDNTLGRTWYEMRQGDTRLREQCHYLVRLPDEPIPARPPKDPREIRVLDPACGSGHFLLYAFELLETIYIEDYDQSSTASKLVEDFPDRETFLRQVPRLILENNLHGIDIDRRAAQIASLALWLRAQRAYTEMKITPRSRPLFQRSNIVCAEPMPGEFDLLGEFLRDLKPKVLERILRKIWDRMKVAGEAGSLLKIEREIREEIHEAHELLKHAPPPVQLTLFGPSQPAVQLVLEFREVTDEAFWEQAEQRVLEELRHYAQQASNGQGVTRRLFAHDAAQGFAFVNLLQVPFDIVLMNPPFGAPSLWSKDYIITNYPRTKNDLYAAFVERGLELLHPGGMLGAITSRTGFFLKTFQQWREEILLKESELTVMADLGYGVLDTAMVETAAYVIRRL